MSDNKVINFLDAIPVDKRDSIQKNRIYNKSDELLRCVRELRRVDKFFKDEEFSEKIIRTCNNLKERAEDCRELLNQTGVPFFMQAKDFPQLINEIEEQLDLDIETWSRYLEKHSVDKIRKRMKNKVKNKTE